MKSIKQAHETKVEAEVIEYDQTIQLEQPIQQPVFQFFVMQVMLVFNIFRFVINTHEEEPPTEIVINCETIEFYTTRLSRVSTPRAVPIKKENVGTTNFNYHTVQ